jgi:phenylpyruvate tautomerase PptA (4-oxalocrotonate tautomerase family)
VSEDNRFMTLSEHEPANFRHGNAYGVTRSDDVVYIRITVFDTRSAQQKQALFRRLAELLAESPGLRGEDLFVNIVDSPKENWSVGHGLAQFA